MVAPAPPSTDGLDDLGRPHRPRRVEALGHGVHGDHLGTAEDREPGGQQADHALTEDRDPVAEPGLGREHGVEGDRADAREGAGDGVVRGPGPVADRGGRDDGLAAVTPDAVHHVADGGRPDVVGDLDHLTDLGVPPPLHRVGEGRVAVHEQPAVGVPGARQVRVRAAVGGELRAGRDAGVPRAQPHRAGHQRLRVARDQRHVVRRGERDDLGHDVLLGDRGGAGGGAVGQGRTGLSPSPPRR